MDTSFWIQCNPKITVEHTNKKYFGKYLYKLVVYCPAGRLIDSKGSMTEALEHRRLMARNINQSGWWGYRYNKDLENTDIEFLEKLRDIKHDPEIKVKLRIEEPRVQIYADSDSALKDLVKIHFTNIQQDYVESVSGPANAECEEILNSNAIIRRKDNGYQYKVILKDGRYSSEIKEQLLSYLLNLGPEQVKLSKSAIEMLQKSTAYIWNLYFYANDKDLISFLNLIQPGIVSNCHELVVAH